jgi:DNA primase
MKKRGLDEKTIRHFNIGVENGNLLIPLFDKTNTLVGIRKRQNPFIESDLPRYFVESGTKAILFNEVVLDRNPREVYITEGEFDAMVLRQK